MWALRLYLHFMALLWANTNCFALCPCTVSFSGDIGGQMGLFIGASILTILEILDYIYEVHRCHLCLSAYSVSWSCKATADHHCDIVSSCGIQTLQQPPPGTQNTVAPSCVCFNFPQYWQYLPLSVLLSSSALFQQDAVISKNQRTASLNVITHYACVELYWISRLGKLISAQFCAADMLLTLIIKWNQLCADVFV